jgi:hypothetical protein
VDLPGLHHDRPIDRSDGRAGLQGALHDLKKFGALEVQVVEAVAPVAADPHVVLAAVVHAVIPHAAALARAGAPLPS